MRHENIVTKNIWRASYNGIWPVFWTIIYITNSCYRFTIYKN